MNIFQPFFDKNSLVFLDGALSTELERRGAHMDTKLWSAIVLQKSPDLIRQVHLDYFLAGADIATTATYQATFEGFEASGFSGNQAMELMHLSVQLAREARDNFWEDKENRKGRIRPLVAAAAGPYGAFLADGSEYRGNYGLSEKELMDFHRPRLEVLISAGADLIAFETIPCLQEAAALIRLMETFPEQAAWLSYSCRDEKHISEGENIETAVALANTSPAIQAVGINCTHPRFVENLLKQASQATGKPLVVYPNSGEEWDAAQKRWKASPESCRLSDYAMQWKNAGARLIGGCCRTTPEDIRRLRSLLSAPHI